MMIKKYKIGNFAIEVRSQEEFRDDEPYSLFLFDGAEADYCVDIDFSSDLPQKIENPYYTSQDRVCTCEDGALRCYYKSRDNEDEFYACRSVNGKNMHIVIDEKYRGMLWPRVVFSLIGIEELVTENNGCVLHSSFIEKDGGAVLFTGPCNIGKSTQAELWKEYSAATVVNGDKTLIFEKDGVFYASGMPFSGSSKYCLNKVLPLKAVVGLDRATVNTANRLASTEAFYKLYKNCYPVPYSRECTDMLIDFVQKLSQTVPIYEYACRADEGAVRYLERELCPILQSH